MEGGSSLTGPNLAACALALCYAYRDPNVPPSPLCSRLLSHSARLVLSASQTPSTSLEGFLEELRSALDAAPSTSSLAVVDPDALIDELCETIRLLLVEAATRPAAFHALFQRVDRVLFRPEDEEHDVDSDDGDDEEIVDEEGNRIPRRPRHIDARSPLGRFLRGIYARYSGADEGSIVKAAAQLDAWVNGQALWPNDQALDEDEKPASARYRLAMLRGDYTTARAVREGSLDQAPGEYDARLHHTLLADAEFYLDTKAFEMARDSLNEALHVARASRDLDFLAVCDRVMRRIQCQEEMYQPAGSITSPGHGGASTMGERFARSDIWELQRGIDRGQPRARVLAFLEESSHQQPASHISGTQRSLLMAQMWSEVGIQEAAAASTKPHTHQLSFVLHEAWRLAEGGDYEAALSMLIDVDLVDRLTFPSYQRWFPALWRIVYLEARRASRSKAVSAIRRIYPDVARDVDGEVATDVDTKAADRDEVMHCRRIRATSKEQLLGQLRTATECFGRVGQRRRALAMVKEVEERAERAQMYVVYRMARLARVEVLLMDDDHVMLDDDEEEENDDGGQEGYKEQGEAGSERRPRKNNGEVARNMLEQILPQCLVDVDVERRAQAKWAYARSLLAHLQARRDAERTVAARDVEAEEQEALQWLEQSEKDYEKAGMLRQQSMVLTAILALLQSGQGQRDSEVETVARRSEAVKMRADEAEHAPFYRPIDERVAQIKSLVGLVGARVVAGA